VIDVQDNEEETTKNIEEEVNKIMEEIDLDLSFGDEKLDDLTSGNDNNQKKGTNFRNYNDDQFPLFTTIREFLYLIDSTLQVPFFDRGQNGEMTTDDHSVFHSQDERMRFMTNSNKEKFQSEDLLFSSNKSDNNINVPYPEDFLGKPSSNEGDDFYDPKLLYRMKNFDKKKGKNLPKYERYMSEEVTYEKFRDEFYPLIVYKLNSGFMPISKIAQKQLSPNL